MSKIDIEGFNGSILRTIAGSYLGLIRRDISINKEGVYPQTYSSLHFFELSSEFEVMYVKDLHDTLDREKHISWSSGLEDPRILTKDSCLCVTLDTNTEWKAEISYVKFDSDSSLITKIQPLVITDLPRQIEKNWVVLNVDEGEATILYSTKPLIILRVHLESGIGKVIYKNIGIPYHTHNGSVVALDDGSFLLSLRVKDGIHYKQSLWVKMRNDYSIESISPPYRFTTNEFRDDYVDHTVFEMCMSLHLEGEHLIACLGMNDTHLSIFKISLTYILSNLILI